MCVVSKKGYTFESTGRTIPLAEIDLAELDPAEFKELKETNVSMLTQMQMDSKLDKLIYKIDKAISLSEKINKDSNLHKKYCPLNEDAIQDLFNNWYGGIMAEYNDIESPRGKRMTAKIILDVKTWIKDTILTTGNLAWSLTAMVIFFGGIGLIVYLASIAGSK